MASTQPTQLLHEAVRSLEAGNRDGAANAVAALVRNAPPLGDHWSAVGRIGAAIGELDLAQEAMRRFSAVAPRDPARAVAFAAVLAEAGKADAAIRVLEPFSGRQPPNPQVLHLIGTLQSQLGRFETARDFFERALSVWPLSGHSWLGLAAIHRYSADDPELRRLEAQRSAMAAANPEARAAFLYALGKAYDDAGAADEAFAAFSEGAALIRPTRGYDARSEEALVEAILSGFGLDVMAELKDDTDLPTARPIFVTGIPRSGTTLVEQMLVSHPAVDEGGEINLFPHVLRKIGGATPAAAGAYIRRSGGAGPAWTAAAGLYLHLLKQRIPGDGRAVDKTLSSSRSLGLISLILPEAPLVWVRRDPLDVAWSCFRTLFSRGVPWSWSLADIAHHMRLEERLLAHWSEVLGARLLVVDYEDLVAQPDEEGARILGHCGLAQQSLREFDKTERAVTTSSSAQVRRPLYGSSIGAAGPYRAHLQPFIDAYEARGGG